MVLATALVSFIPQIVTFTIKLVNFILETNKEMTAEEMQKWLDMTYDEIAVKKKIVKNPETGDLEWKIPTAISSQGG